MIVGQENPCLEWKGYNNDQTLCNIAENDQLVNEMDFVKSGCHMVGIIWEQSVATTTVLLLPFNWLVSTPENIRTPENYAIILPK